MAKTRSYNISYRRILIIDSEVSRGRYPNSTKLSKECEISISTVKRDIKYMKLVLKAPILYDESRKGYYYTEKTFKLPALFTNEEGIFSASVALKLLSQYKNTPIYGNIKNIFDNFHYAVFDAKDKDVLWFENRVLFIPTISPENIDSEVWDTIISAMRENKYIEFSYDEGYPRGKITSVYNIAPYQVISKNCVWYLADCSKEKGDIAVYAVNRIIDIKQFEEEFDFLELYQHLDPNEHLMGVYSYTEIITCKVKFLGESRGYVSERVWSSDQNIKECEDGSIDLTFKTGQLKETLRFIISQGRNAIPISPKELVDDWKEEIKSMSKNAEF